MSCGGETQQKHDSDSSSFASQSSDSHSADILLSGAWPPIIPTPYDYAAFSRLLVEQNSILTSQLKNIDNNDHKNLTLAQYEQNTKNLHVAAQSMYNHALAHNEHAKRMLDLVTEDYEDYNRWLAYRRIKLQIKNIAKMPSCPFSELDNCCYCRKKRRYEDHLVKLINCSHVAHTWCLKNSLKKEKIDKCGLCGRDLNLLGL